MRSLRQHFKQADLLEYAASLPDVGARTSEFARLNAERGRREQRHVASLNRLARLAMLLALIWLLTLAFGLT
jgi:hypothetical protein